MLYIDSNISIYPIIYNETAVKEASKSKEFLLKIALGKIEAYTSSITWDEVVWVVWKLFGIDVSLNQGRKFLNLPKFETARN